MTSSNTPQFIILCEDSAHDRFIREYLVSLNIKKRDIHTVDNFLNSSPRPHNNATVIKTYPKLIREYRSRKNSRSLAVVVMIDGDGKTIQNRRKVLHEALDRTRGSLNNDTRERDEKIALLVPARNIENWFYFIQNLESSGDMSSDIYDESRDRKGELYGNSDATTRDQIARQSARSLLTKICSQPESERPKLPDSLFAACREFRRLQL